jgi:hypothetical protein
MKLLYATLLVILPTVCVAQCKTATAVLKVKVVALERNKGLLLKKLNEHGCKHRLAFVPVEEGFNYRISLSDAQKARPTFSQAGVGTAYTEIVRTIVYDDKDTVLFQVERGNLLTHAVAVNASAKEIVKRLLLRGLPKT